LLHEVLPELQRTGFDITPFGGGSFVIQGVPPGLPAGSEQALIEQMLNNLKHEAPTAGDARAEQVLLSLAKKLSFADAPETQEAMRAVIDELFACAQPEFSPRGKRVFSVVVMDTLLGVLS
jgi:DNA mismatch repair protein MutL